MICASAQTHSHCRSSAGIPSLQSLYTDQLLSIIDTRVCEMAFYTGLRERRKKSCIVLELEKALRKMQVD